MKIIKIYILLLITLVTYVSCVFTNDGPKRSSRESGDIFLNENHETGFIPIRPDGDALFYWLMRSRSSTPYNDPLVIWLTGGPGCSSSVAIFEENGPWKINPDLTLKTNPFSWNNNANVVYMDQPLGTGFSKVKEAA